MDKNTTINKREKQIGKANQLTLTLLINKYIKTFLYRRCIQCYQQTGCDL